MSFDSDLLVQFGEKDLSVQILNGCNTHSGFYKAFTNGSVFFDSFISTLMACSDDQDSKYLNALNSGVTFE